MLGGNVQMNFNLNQEQSMIKRTIREFAREEVAPGAVERDRNKQFPKAIFDQLGGVGDDGPAFS